MGENIIVGSGEFRYKINENWENLPNGFSWKETAGVIADNYDDIYASDNQDYWYRLGLSERSSGTFNYGSAYESSNSIKNELLMKSGVYLIFNIFFCRR